MEDKQKLNLCTSSSPIACVISKIQQFEILFLSFHTAQHQNRNSVCSLTILSIRRCVYVHVYATIMEKSLWDTFAFLGHFPMHTGPLPSPHKQCWTVVSRMFFEFQLCIWLGEEKLQEMMHCFKRELRNDRKI